MQCNHSGWQWKLKTAWHALCIRKKGNGVLLFYLECLYLFIYCSCCSWGVLCKQRQMYWAEMLNVLHNRYECAGEHHITCSGGITGRLGRSSLWLPLGLWEIAHLEYNSHLVCLHVWKSKKPYLELSVDCVLFLLSFADVLLPSRRLFLSHLPPSFPAFSPDS